MVKLNIVWTGGGSEERSFKGFEITSSGALVLLYQNGVKEFHAPGTWLKVAEYDREYDL